MPNDECPCDMGGGGGEVLLVAKHAQGRIGVNYTQRFIPGEARHVSTRYVNTGGTSDKWVSASGRKDAAGKRDEMFWRSTSLTLRWRTAGRRPVHDCTSTAVLSQMHGQIEFEFRPYIRPNN